MFDVHNKRPRHYAKEILDLKVKPQDIRFKSQSEIEEIKKNSRDARNKILASCPDHLRDLVRSHVKGSWERV